MVANKEFGVETPITIGQPKDYDWHVWRRGDAGDTWMGFFKDPQTALDWCRTQPGNMVVNNVPPSTSKRYVNADDVPVSTRQRYNSGPTQAPKRRTARKTAPAVFSSPTHQPVVPVQPDNSPEAKVLRKDAAVRLDQHRKDEAKDIAEGTTEGI